MVHGRFQPFHNGHLDYMRKALDRSGTLIVGITNPDPEEIREESASAHRHLLESNPFTYFQRLQMVLGAFADNGIDPMRLRVVPFHIHEPRKWRYYLPAPDRLVHFVRVFSDWEQTKVDRIRSEGYRVEVLDPGIEKGVEGSDIRRRIADGDASWRDLVPAATARVMEEAGVLRHSP